MSYFSSQNVTKWTNWLACPKNFSCSLQDSAIMISVGMSVEFYRYRYNLYWFSITNISADIIALNFRRIALRTDIHRYSVFYRYHISVVTLTDTYISVLPIWADIGRYWISAGTEMQTLIMISFSFKIFPVGTICHIHQRQHGLKNDPKSVRKFSFFRQLNNIIENFL